MNYNQVTELKKSYKRYKSTIKNNSNYTLTVLINFHTEGMIAKKVIHNLIDVIQEHQSYSLWSDIEVIAILDKADSITKSNVQQFKSIFKRIYEVEFGDPTMARNFGIERANNNFILVSDGDDYVSLSCLNSLFKVVYEYYTNTLKDENFNEIPIEDHIGVFPAKLLSFPKMWLQTYSNSNDNIIENNRFEHTYTAKILICKTVLEKIKYKSIEEPYGMEDWYLNNRLLSAGVRFYVADYTIYYRKLDNIGMVNFFKQNKRILENSDLYTKEIQFKKHKVEFDGLAIEEVEYNFVKEAAFIEHINFLKKHEKTTDLTFISKDVHTMQYQSKNLVPQTIIYKYLLSFLEDKDFVFMVPYVTCGGADKLMIEHALSIKQTNYKPCIITELGMGDRIAYTGLHCFDFNTVHSHWRGLTNDVKLHIIFKAIINSKIKIIHIINSDLALQLVHFYGDVLKEYGIKVVISLYCPDYDVEKEAYSGYPVTYPSIMTKAEIVLSDNVHYYPLFKELAGKDFNHKKLFSPIDAEPVVKTVPTSNKRILWAGRICNQKLIEVLYGVIRYMPDYKFVLYGYAGYDSYANDFFKLILKMKNVEYRGLYNHISELDMNEFDLLLFTSKFEGLSFIRLDFINYNLPVVSSNVQGSEEVFGGNYELLVNDVEVFDGYVSAIRKYYKNPEYYFNKVKEIRERNAVSHDAEKFRADYLEVIKQLEVSNES